MLCKASNSLPPLGNSDTLQRGSRMLKKRDFRLRANVGLGPGAQQPKQQGEPLNHRNNWTTILVGIFYDCKRDFWGMVYQLFKPFCQALNMTRHAIALSTSGPAADHSWGSQHLLLPRKKQGTTDYRGLNNIQYYFGGSLSYL